MGPHANSFLFRCLLRGGEASERYAKIRVRRGTRNLAQHLYFLCEKTFCTLKSNYSCSETCPDKEMSEREHMILKLICQDKLNISYDKLPSSYTGYRSYMAHGVPLEKQKPVTIARLLSNISIHFYRIMSSLIHMIQTDYAMLSERSVFLANKQVTMCIKN